jgi:tetratricopeptide (TPR) repeat protein
MPSRERTYGRIVSTAGSRTSSIYRNQVTASIVAAIAPKVEQAEIERAKRKPTERLDAYDYFLRGLPNAYSRTKEATEEGLRLFYEAINRDPDLATAYGMAAWCYGTRFVQGWMTDRVRETAETERLARRAVELGKDDAVALCTGGFELALVVGDLDRGATFIDRALALNPNLATAWFTSGWAKVWRGMHDVAIEHLARAMRLSPLDPRLDSLLTATASAISFLVAMTKLCHGRKRLYGSN